MRKFIQDRNDPNRCINFFLINTQYDDTRVLESYNLLNDNLIVKSRSRLNDSREQNSPIKDERNKV